MALYEIPFSVFDPVRFTTSTVSDRFRVNDPKSPGTAPAPAPIASPVDNRATRLFELLDPVEFRNNALSSSTRSLVSRHSSLSGLEQRERTDSLSKRLT